MAATGTLTLCEAFQANMLYTGATPFSMYNTNPLEMLAYLFGNAEPRVVVCEKHFVPEILAAVQLGGGRARHLHRR